MSKLIGLTNKEPSHGTVKPNQAKTLKKNEKKPNRAIVTRGSYSDSKHISLYFKIVNLNHQKSKGGALGVRKKAIVLRL